MLRFPGWLDTFDLHLTRLAARYGITALRVSIGIVFFWFGALKLVPGLSPADSLIRETVPLVPMDIFIPVLAVWEMIIGVGLISGRFMRTTILLLIAQMAGTTMPVFVRPDLVFTIFPVALTMEGQYIVKNLVLISAALVIGATVRGGRLTSEPGAH